MVFKTEEAASEEIANVRHFLDACRERYVSVARTVIAGLPDGGLPDPDYVLGELTISPVELERAGDELVAYRITQNYEDAGRPAQVVVDKIIVRSGNRVQLLDYSGPGRAPSKTHEQALVRRAAEKLSGE